MTVNINKIKIVTILNSSRLPMQVKQVDLNNGLECGSPNQILLAKLFILNKVNQILWLIRNSFKY